MPFDRFFEVINSNLFKDLSKEDKNTLFNLILQNRNRLKSSNGNKIPVTFIANEGLFAKLSLLLPALSASTNIHVPMILGLDQPERKILLNHLCMLKKFRPAPYSEKIETRLHSCKSSYISPPEKFEQMIKKIKFKPRNADKNFIASTVVNLLLCHPQAAFFLLSFGEGLSLKKYEHCHSLAVKLMEICKLLRVKCAYMITYIDQPLGSALGSRLVLKEVFATADGKGPHDLLKLGIEIGAELMTITKIFHDKNRAKCHIKQQIISGRTLDELKRCWGLPKSAILLTDFKATLNTSPIRSIHLSSQVTGFIQPFPVAKIIKLQELFFKRKDILGMFFNKKTGEKVTKKDTLATVFVSKESDVNYILEKISPLFSIKKHINNFCPLIIERGSSN